MQLQAILRKIHPHPGFVYGRVELCETDSTKTLHVHVRPRKGTKAFCSGCGQKRVGYDTLAQRAFAFVPLWGIPVFLLYSMRRVNCRQCGVKVEMVPWAEGKSHTTHALLWFLASWAKVLAWKEVAHRFRTSWDTVFRCVEYAVQWGLQNRSLDGIRAIGVDELAWRKGHKYLTLVYQLDPGCRRLLWIGRDRTCATFERFFDVLGETRTKGLAFVASDMWRAFLSVVKKRASTAVHVLDRFHVAQRLSRAVDEVRRKEVRELRNTGRHPLLTHARWILLKRSEKLTAPQKGRLQELVRVNLRTVRAYLLKESLQGFWAYLSPYWAGRFLDGWIQRASRSKLPPFVAFAQTLRRHRPLLLNWFRARHAFAHGAVEGFNNKARITTRKAYGFRSADHAEIALYHSLGNLPEPSSIAHRFC